MPAEPVSDFMSADISDRVPAVGGSPDAIYRRSVDRPPTNATA